MAVDTEFHRYPQTVRQDSTIRGNSLFRQLAAILQRRISPITTKSILKLLMEKEKLDPWTLTRAELEILFQSKVFQRIRLYCEQEQLTSIMLDLAELIEE